MAMMARSPVAVSWQKTTCSWAELWSERVKTPSEAKTPIVWLSYARWVARPGWGRSRGGGGSRRCHETNAARPVRTDRWRFPPPGESPALWSASRFPCDDRAVPTLFASYLRVYEPLSAFDRKSQAYWQRYVHDGRAVTPAEGPGRQRTAVLEGLGASWTRLPNLPDEAYVLQVNE